MSTPRRIISEEIKQLIRNKATVDVPLKKSLETVAHIPQPAYELGDLLISYLEQIDVEYVFGIPGGPIEPIYNALARSERREGLKAIVARHETGAAFMADGYARNTGKLGVCCATAGPGATNILTGVASAYDNHVPMLVITGQTSMSNFGRGATQESGDTGINTVAIFDHCTRYSSLVSHVDQFEHKLMSAIAAATNVPYGPAHISVPVDVMRCASPVISPTYELSKVMWQSTVPDPEQLKVLCKKLTKSNKIVLIIGEGAEPAVSSFLKIAFMLNATIVTTPHGKGLVSPYHPLYRGVVGFAGHDSALDEITQAETILAIGTPLQEFATNGWSIVNEIGSRLIHIDESETYFTRSPSASMHIKGGIQKTLEAIAEQLKIQALVDSGENSSVLEQSKLSLVSNNHEINRELNFVMDNPDKLKPCKGRLKPQRLMHLLPKLLPPETRYLCDAGNCIAWTIHYLHPGDRRIKDRRDSLRYQDINNQHVSEGRRESRGSVFWTPLEYSSMGWSIGSSIGTSLACPGVPVVSIVGDGAILMSGNDLSVAVQEGLNIIFVILNDSEFGMVKQGQRLAGGEPIAYTLPKTNFVEWAKSLGAKGFEIATSKELENLDIENIVNTSGPVVLDVLIDPEEVPPMKSRLEALGSA